jgi:hypothetical protein
MRYLEARGRDVETDNIGGFSWADEFSNRSGETTLGSRQQRAVGAIPVNKTIGLTFRCWIKLYEP